MCIRDRGNLERELCIEREIELYKLKRNYNELRERLEGVKINNIKYLPVEREIENYFDTIFVNDNDLPDVIVEEYKNERIPYLTLTNNTDGDWTIITHVDKIYNGIMNGMKLMDYYNNNNNKWYVDNNDACYKYIRYIYDDGG